MLNFRIDKLLDVKQYAGNDFRRVEGMLISAVDVDVSDENIFRVIPTNKENQLLFPKYIGKNIDITFNFSYDFAEFFGKDVNIYYTRLYFLASNGQVAINETQFIDGLKNDIKTYLDDVNANPSLYIIEDYLGNNNYEINITGISGALYYFVFWEGWIKSTPEGVVILKN